MSDFYKSHKKLCNILIILISAVLLGTYLWALLRPGQWHNEAFLYRRDAGIYDGWDVYGKYSMKISRSDTGANIAFTVNGEERSYSITNLPDTQSVQISENGKIIFDGTAIIFGDTYGLIEKNGDITDIITVRAGNQVPTNDELFPSCTKLYNWAVAKKDDTRGEPLALLVILLIAALMALDIIYPDLFFTLKHMWSVDGGTPSAFYRFGQVVGRVVSVLLIIVTVFISFSAP